MHVVNPDDGSWIIEWSDAKFQILQIARWVPLATNSEICSWGVNFFPRYSVALNEKWLIVFALDVSLVVIFIFDSDGMCVFLVFASYCTFVNPFSIIFTESVKIDPECSLAVRSDSLWSLKVNWDLIAVVLNVGECCGGIGVSIEVIIFFLTEKCFIILVFEQFSVNSQPSVRVGHKFVLVVDGCSNFKVQIL